MVILLRNSGKLIHVANVPSSVDFMYVVHGSLTVFRWHHDLIGMSGFPVYNKDHHNNKHRCRVEWYVDSLKCADKKKVAFYYFL